MLKYTAVEFFTQTLSKICNNYMMYAKNTTTCAKNYAILK